MKAWIASRRLTAAEQQNLGDRLSGLRKPDGASALYLLHSDDDPSEVSELSLWPDARQLEQYRAGLASQSQSDPSVALAAEPGWRSYTVWPVSAGRGIWRYWPVLPTLASIASAAGLIARARQPQPRQRVVSQLRPGRRGWLILPGLLAVAGAGLFFLRDRLSGGVQTEGARPSREWEQRRPAAAPAAGPGMPAATMPGSRLLVRDVMTPSPETIDYEAGLVSAAAKMRELNVGVLPVLADGQLAGMITDRDIALSLAEGGDTIGSLHVYDVMSAVPVTTRPDVTVQEASAVMAAQQVRRLPVVEGTELVGILSLGDVAAEDSGSAAGAALQEISEPAEPQR